MKPETLVKLIEEIEKCNIIHSEKAFYKQTIAAIKFKSRNNDRYKAIIPN